MQNLPKPTSNQDFFNKVWQWLIVDAKPICLSPNRLNCVYRNGDDACIIGAFLPDELVAKFSDTQSKQSIDELIQDPIVGAEIKAIFDQTTFDGRILGQFQRVHDNSSISHRKGTLKELAKRFNLAIPQANEEPGTTPS